jgi:hypothetical protein
MEYHVSNLAVALGNTLQWNFPTGYVSTKGAKPIRLRKPQMKLEYRLRLEFGLRETCARKLR